MTSKVKGIDNLFQIQRIYTKDISFEVPGAPIIFQKEWKPEIKVDIDTSSSKLIENIYEVIVKITVTTFLGENTEIAFLCEVQQNGIFLISGVNKIDMDHCLGAYCPNILFPYARECIASLVSRGTFPQLNLAPINFDILFLNSLKNKKNNDKTN